VLARVLRKRPPRARCRTGTTRLLLQLAQQRVQLTLIVQVSPCSVLALGDGQCNLPGVRGAVLAALAHEAHKQRIVAPVQLHHG